MTNIPLGTNAYKRDFGGEPEVVLQNRYVEKDPANTVEKTTLVSRAGSNSLGQCAGGTDRGNFSKLGMFNGDLFKVSGHNLWRINALTGVATQITGTITGDGNPYFTWMKGIGYEYLFVSDGVTLQYFSEHASGVLTLLGNIQEGFVIDIGGVYYGWSATVDHGSPAGTVTNPYWALLASGGVSTAANNTQSLVNMAAALNFSGVVGQFSAAITGPSTTITAASDETTLTLVAIDNTTAGNAITTSVNVGGGAIAFGAATLTGGGGAALAPVTGMAAGEVAKACMTVSGYVLVSVGNSQKAYFINPGEVKIDPLNFFEKESNPDNILDMLAVGDQGLIMGNGSTEAWYATGVFAAPFAPVEGRVYQRGVVEGTPANVGDAVCIVGNDGVAYLIGTIYGSESPYGVHRISTNGIEERIRTQLRMEQGTPP